MAGQVGRQMIHIRLNVSFTPAFFIMDRACFNLFRRGGYQTWTVKLTSCHLNAGKGTWFRGACGYSQAICGFERKWPRCQRENCDCTTIQVCIFSPPFITTFEADARNPYTTRLTMSIAPMVLMLTKLRALIHTKIPRNTLRHTSDTANTVRSN